ncbi:hypothetical protein V1525DRAFT_359342 [Lipomyces kononenkoae]|uniref:Uncharacterized protein n=1 Tax=Lipomyces kononenkoae TaxID=34357 RepID=A0ACC3T2D9_LIPKO
MPLDIAWTVISQGPSAIPFWPYIKSYAPWVGAIYLLKRFFSGTANTWERDMHGRVVMVTGGTSGIGAEVVEDLAERGAQIILLVKSLSDGWLVEYIADLRNRKNNNLIYAEEVDLSSLHSIRVFATKWLDNSPPRRLDMVICCAGMLTPPFKQRIVTADGIEAHWGINYVAHYHLLTLLSPSFRVQPADRDVRIILSGCSSYVLADFDITDPEFKERGFPSSNPWRSFGSAKLALLMFLQQFQRTLDEYKRPDGNANNVRVFMANPGIVRTSTTRNFLTLGSLWGLLVYLIMWPIWWLVLKSPRQGAQTILHVAMSPECAHGNGGKVYNECAEVTRKSPRKEVEDEELGKRLWDVTAKQIEEAERRLKSRKENMESENTLNVGAKAAASATSTGPKKKSTKKV